MVEKINNQLKLEIAAEIQAKKTGGAETKEIREAREKAEADIK